MHQQTGWHHAVAPPRDDTTRYVCAAAHLDAEFADKAIREFLVEPTRPIPSSPGLNAAAALSEAVAARTRRKLRDGVLIALMITFVIVVPFATVAGWVALALLVVLPKATSLARGRKNPAVIYLLIILVAVVLGTVAFSGLGQLLGSSRSRYAPAGTLASAQSWPAFVLGGAMLAVLLADRLIVWRLMTRTFGKNAPPPPADPFQRPRQIFTCSPPRFITQVRRYVHAAMPMELPAGAAPVVVYRGFNPFVGTGPEHDSAWSAAIPLERLSNANPDLELSTDLLYIRIREAIGDLAKSPTLTPGKRLRDLTSGEQIVVSAQELVDHLGEPDSRTILPNLNFPPSPALPGEQIDRLRAQPAEWARYYLRFQAETWDGDLVLTVHVHAAMDENTLYVEWTPCVLLPVDLKYQRIDRMPTRSLAPVGQALARLVKLPATILGRTWHTIGWIGPMSREHGRIYPELYGSLCSLRELAAGPDVHQYFQLTDVSRYLKIMHSRYVKAIADLLHECGYSPASFKQQAVVVTHNSVNIGGSMTGNLIIGSENTAGNVKST